MDFIMRYLSNEKPSRMKHLLHGLTYLMLVFSSQAFATSASQISHSINHQQLLMHGQLVVELPDEIRQAIKQEIPILFKTQIQLKQERELIVFNFPKRLTEINYQTELRYSHFYQTYTLHNLRNGNRLTFSQLDEALNILGRFQEFPLIELSQLHAGLHYQLAVSIGVDWKKLSAPLFNQALFNQAWQYNTGTIHHALTLGSGT